MIFIAITFLVACSVSFAVVPPVRQLCERWNLTDRPDGHRKLHHTPVPLGGGIAVFLSTIGVCLGVILIGNSDPFLTSGRGADLVGLALSGTIMLLVGVADDAIGLRGRQKLLGQIIACSIPVFRGLVIERLQVFGWTIELGALSAPTTMLWLLAAVNAVNLLDGINGLATMVGLIDCLAITLLSAIAGHQAHALLAAAFAGSLLGFLRYNFPKAKMFLGDAGAMLIGLVVGVLSIESSLKGPGTVLLFTPLCLMTVPLFDSTAAMMRRKLTGRSIFSGDRAHIQHRLSERFGSVRAVGIVSLCCGLTGTAALASRVWRNELVALISGASIVAMFVVFRVFGHAELRLLASRVQGLGASFLLLNFKGRRRATQSTVRLQGSRQWKRLWDGLTQASEELPIDNIELNLHAPMIQEGFHASWKRAALRPDDTWRLDLPLVVEGHRIGRIWFAGNRHPHLPSIDVEKILCLFETFESQLAATFSAAAVVTTAFESEKQRVANRAILATTFDTASSGRA